MSASERSGSTPTVVVSGDVTMDWSLARRVPLGAGGGWHPELRARARRQRGGAALLADLVVAALGQGTGGGASTPPQVLDPGLSAERSSPDERRYSHSYAVWIPCEVGDGDEGHRVWRVDPPMGLDRATTEAGVGEEWERLAADLPRADTIVLDDANLGFREHSRPDVWARVAEAGRDPWVLLKASRPVAQGPLWEHLGEHHAHRLVVLMTIEDLRGTDVQVSRELSWERTAQDLLWELVHNPLVNGLSRVAYTVVSFGAAGAVLFSGLPGRAEGGAARCSLLFDPEAVEGSWESELPGAMVGTTACLAASLTRELSIAPDGPDLEAAIGSGVGAVRRLWKAGYGSAEEGMDVAFPFGAVAEQIVTGESPLAAAVVEDPAGSLPTVSGTEGGAPKERAGEGDGEAHGAPGPSPGIGGSWTILEDRYSGDLLGVAEQVVRFGPEVALRGVPLGRFGKLLTVDRGEIESFRAVRALITEYCRSSQATPLSVGVFGAPGSGKSFVMVQMAQTVAAGLISDKIEFNLSQFDSPADLHHALHQVRDVGLSGTIPLVCWDEFDAGFEGKQLGWLRYFLAPMEDGAFRQGQLLHPMGRAIFVFAGGTSHRMEDFGHGIDEKAFRALKGPDFISRLKGYVNVLGPNPREDRPDPHHIVRRAIWLRSILWRDHRGLFRGDGELRIDRGVLRAFLETGKYGHGGRSMESIVTASRLAGETSFQRSSLPSETQLDLHVNGREFLSLVQRMEIEGELFERLAEVNHEIFCEGLRERGYSWGEGTDDKQGTHSALVAWDELPDHLKEQNYGAVRDIPEKLGLIDHVMIPARSHDAPYDFPGEALEELARYEHARFVEAKLADGWCYGKKTDDELKTNPTLVPWEELSEEEREKDRSQVRGIPRVLARAGYTVVRSAGGAEADGSR